MYKIVLFFCLNIVVMGCDDNAGFINDTDEIAVIDTDCAAIIEYDPENFTVKRFFKEYTAKDPVQVLTVGEMRLLDNALYQFLSAQIIKDMEWFEVAKGIYPEENFILKNFMIDITKYRRQYMFVRNEKGERIVWCIFFCEEIFRDLDSDRQWKDIPFIGYGGGNCLFNFKVNLSTAECFDVSVNAEA